MNRRYFIIVSIGLVIFIIFIFALLNKTHKEEIKSFPENLSITTEETPPSQDEEGYESVQEEGPLLY